MFFQWKTPLRIGGDIDGGGQTRYLSWHCRRLIPVPRFIGHRAVGTHRLGGASVFIDLFFWIRQPQPVVPHNVQATTLCGRRLSIFESGVSSAFGTQ